MRSTSIIIACILTLTLASSYPGFSQPTAGFSISVQDDTLTITATDDAVYYQGWYSVEGSGWEPFNFSGQTTNGWLLQGTAAKTITIPQTNNENYAIIYSCTQGNVQGSAGSPWNCHGNRWQLIAFNTSTKTNLPTNSMLLAKGFENEGALVLPFVGVTTGGQVETDDTVAYSGDYSLKITSADDANSFVTPSNGQDSVLFNITQGPVTINFSAMAYTTAGTQGYLSIFCLGEDYRWWDHDFSDEYNSHWYTTQPQTWQHVWVSHTCDETVSYVSVRLAAEQGNTNWYDDPILTITSGEGIFKNGQVVGGCEKDNDCNDGNELTINKCQAGKCTSVSLCKTDGNCHEGCGYPQDPDCDQCTSPTNCNQGNNCQSATCSGSPKRCGLNIIASCQDGDGCCPSGCSFANDDDCTMPSQDDEKPRIVLLADPNPDDSGKESDDSESFVRYLVYANEFDTEGIISTVSHNSNNGQWTQAFHSRIDAYEDVRDNLLAHEDDYPTADALRDVIGSGPAIYGVEGALSSAFSSGAQIITDALAADDDRPIWVLVWGDGATLVQVLQRLEDTQGHEAATAAAKKLRVIDSAGQDDSGAWLAHHYPELFYVRLTNLYYAMDPKSDEMTNYYPECASITCAGGNTAVANDAWYASHIQTQGKLGDLYPDRVWLHEGDTPTTLYVLPIGLNDPEEPWQGSWGGMFTHEPQRNVRSVVPHMEAGNKQHPESDFDNYYMYRDAPVRWSYDGHTYTSTFAGVFRWWEPFNHDFEARMQWSTTNDYSAVNHPPHVVVDGDGSRQVIRKTAATGSNLQLFAQGTSDPDNDALTYDWWVYPEAGTYQGSITIDGSSSQQATVHIPSAASGKEIHVILAVRDDGQPWLERYRRIIISVS